MKSHVPHWLDRLPLKLTLAGLVFALLTGAALSAVVTNGFDHAQHAASVRSVQGLEVQGRSALFALTQREAQVSEARFSLATQVGQIAAQYLVATTHMQWTVRTHLTRSPSGQYGDPSPTRNTDVFIPRAATVSAAQLRDLNDSAALNALFPSLLKQVPDATVISYISPHALARYYPPIGIPELLSPDYPILQDTSFADALPQADPRHMTVWRAPYIDPAQQGFLVTASTPIYAGAEFRGVIAVDVSLTGLIRRLNTLKPTQNGYAFVIDHNDRLIAAPPLVLGDLLGSEATQPGITIDTMLNLSLADTPVTALRGTLASMRAGRAGVSTIALGGRSVFLSYAPLRGVGWSLGLVAPVNEITRQSTAVAAAIHSDANNTIRSTLAAISACIGIMLLTTLALTRWRLVVPLADLTRATRSVASGDLSVSIPTTRRDELGQLATAFNVMTGQLVQFYDVLEQRVRERTQELSTLLEVSRNVTSTLELAPLLDLILDQLQTMVDYQSATILIIERDDLVIFEYRGPAPHATMIGLRIPLVGDAPHQHVVRTRAPVIEGNVQRDTAITLAFLRETGQVWGNAFGHISSWMGVPLIVKERVLGLMTVIHRDRDFYTPHHAQLATVIAAQAAVAIENAQLYGQAQELAAFKERSRLARELHDSVSQALFGIALGTRTAQTLLARDPARVQEPLHYVLSLAEAGLAEMRALIFELRPESLKTEGLVVALGHRAAALQARHGITLHADLGYEQDVALAVKEAIYRIAQEALHNAVKHAHARTAHIKLDWNAAGMGLEVRDDGQGFDPSASFPGHLGLRSMQERAIALGGTLEIISTPGEGTCIVAWIPYEEALRVVPANVPQASHA